MGFNKTQHSGLVLAISIANHLVDLDAFIFSVVFEVFIKLHEATARSYHGTALVELHLFLFSTDQVLAIVQPDNRQISCHLDVQLLHLLLLLFAFG